MNRPSRRPRLGDEPLRTLEEERRSSGAVERESLVELGQALGRPTVLQQRLGCAEAHVSRDRQYAHALVHVRRA